MPNSNKYLVDFDEKLFCKEIMKRPGMYVGEDRLDYIQHFVSGFSMCSDIWRNTYIKPKWNVDYELQYWSLLNQSMIIRGSNCINGWSVFYRCFGTGRVALGQFAKYLHTEIPEPSVSHPYPAFSNTVSNDVVCLHNEIKNDSSINYGERIIRIVHDMIKSADKEHGLIRIYVRRDYVFCQIRFIFYTDKGWEDDSAVINNPDNYDNLIALHAHAECMSDNELGRLLKHGEYYLTLRNSDDYIYYSSKHNDEKTFYSQYIDWLTHFTASY